MYFWEYETRCTAMPGDLRVIFSSMEFHTVKSASEEVTTIRKL